MAGAELGAPFQNCRATVCLICAELQTQLQQSRRDADLIGGQMEEKEQRVEELMRELQGKTNQTDGLLNKVERMSNFTEVLQFSLRAFVCHACYTDSCH